MRTSIFVLAVILGCALAQTPAPTNQNYCKGTGVFCALCKKVDTNQSCNACGKLGYVSAVAGTTNPTNECKQSTATNCAQALNADKCSVCNEKFAVIMDDGPTKNTCVADSTAITNCAALSKLGTTVTCIGCKLGFAIEFGATADKVCSAAVTGANCNAATVAGGTTNQTCTSCKEGFAFKGTGNTCETPVPSAATGCLKLTADGSACDNLCNSSVGFWMMEENKCTKFAPIAAAAFALIASFFFSN